MKSVDPDHDGEDDSEEGGFEDPEDGETDDLQQREQVNSSERNMPQVGVVRLVLCWHQEQLDPVPELRHDSTNVSTIHLKIRAPNRAELYMNVRKLLALGLDVLD